MKVKTRISLLMGVIMVPMIMVAAQQMDLLPILSEEEFTKSESLAEPQKVTMIVTGYSVDKKQCGKTDGITAMGRNGKKFRGVAADNKLLPLGTKVLIPGVGEMLVDDTGGDMRKAARRGAMWKGVPQKDIIHHIDLRFTGKNAKRRALAWGRQKLEVTILPPTS